VVTAPGLRVCCFYGQHCYRPHFEGIPFPTCPRPLRLVCEWLPFDPRSIRFRFPWPESRLNWSGLAPVRASSSCEVEDETSPVRALPAFRPPPHGVLLAPRFSPPTVPYSSVVVFSLTSNPSPSDTAAEDCSLTRLFLVDLKRHLLLHYGLHGSPPQLRAPTRFISFDQCPPRREASASHLLMPRPFHWSTPRNDE